ncbi:MAG: hypothetical protein IJ525_01220 [Alphaproteobacteria bacterium]|nr:hypothetical protein [Alphaproteobacteria bacterium]
MKTYNAESGRSMIEMLGVLAIIGVLSVGGIAGYSKAMMKYRVNKTIEQITLIAGNVRAFFASQKNYEDIKDYGASGDKNDVKTILKKAKLVPDEMWNEDEINSVYGSGVYIFSDHSNPKAFYLSFSDIPEEACVSLVSHDWPNETQGILFGNLDSLGSSNMQPYGICNYREKGLYSVCRDDLPVSVDDAVEGCTCTNSLCAITFVFK